MVQCKRYGPGNNVGSPDMQRFLGTLHHFRAERGLFVTTAGFTPQARDFAGQHGIELIDGPGLARFGERAASGHAPMAGGRRVAVGAGLLGLLALAMAVDRGVEPEAPAPTPVVAARPIVTRSPTRPPARPASATATNLPLPVLQARTVVAPSMTEAARPTAAPRPTASPRPTVIPPPTAMPRPTATPRPTLTLRPVQRAVRATATPRPTATTRPSTTPRAKATARPTRPPVVRSSRRGGATATAGPGRLGLAAVPEGIPKEATRARIGEVTDGDTVVVEVGGRTEPVRLIGIDAPEARDSNDPAECFGAEATARTARMLPPGREVWLERDVSDRDRYDRLLRYVWFVSREDGGARLANQILVQEGFAVASTYQPDSRYAGRFASAQGAARALGRGLWEACGGADTPLGEAAPEPTARATRTPEPTPRPRASRPTPIPAALETEQRVFPGEEEPAPAAGGAGCDPSYPGLCLPSFPDLD
ncbi:MAG: hypothetical protein AVDCRST_MAG19-3692 [uncultured Thermomicrobiales bacterium]|uniref:TNase-like domain-containing protein n=1 Tax=uncultured Thermomicrobiales bacterium TaxID=1645740 RepID=A0A6J4VJ27_9BACT|nr:MAG: hypothetical protein AVDCRST_MAG19-3692 [uncultured Thermomicrobiales bacterium]